MLKIEYDQTREDGKKLYRTYSDVGMMIRKDGTEEMYNEAIDVEDSGFTYTETDVPIEDGEELTLSDTLAMLSELGVNLDDDEA